jgi:hypothetical protein
MPSRISFHSLLESQAREKGEGERRRARRSERKRIEKRNETYGVVSLIEKAPFLHVREDLVRFEDLRGASRSLAHKHEGKRDKDRRTILNTASSPPCRGKGYMRLSVTRMKFEERRGETHFVGMVDERQSAVSLLDLAASSRLRNAEVDVVFLHAQR